MRDSEQFCKKLFESLNAENFTLKEVKEQSHGEHDFDIVDKDGECVGVIEVTSIIHEESMRSHARTNNQGVIKSENLMYGWLLMAHIPDPLWCRTEGVKCLSILEKYHMKEFSHHDQYHHIEEVSEAVRSLIKKGIENGGAHGESGAISFLTSYGEDDEPYILSAENVVSAMLSELKKPDNAFKLSQNKNHDLSHRILFVEIDPLTYACHADSMVNCDPPLSPPELYDKATEVWMATNISKKTIVWRGDKDGWSQWNIDD